MTPRSPNFIGASCAILAVFLFSANDTIIKFLSDDYALHQVVLIRSIIGLLIVMAVIMPLSGGWSVVRTNRLGFSVIFLGEYVGPRRWAAIGVGLLGVLIVVRPGTDAFQIASLLPIAAAVGYAFIHIIARRIGDTESAATMTFYIQVMFILICLMIGLVIGDGRFGGQSDPSLAFMFRAWRWPDAADAHLFVLIGIGIAGAGYLISQAYRVAEAGFVAPFEYLALPIGIFWGVVVFGDYPDATTLLGAALIIGSGIFNIWRESQLGQAAQRPRHRR